MMFLTWLSPIKMDCLSLLGVFCIWLAEFAFSTLIWSSVSFFVFDFDRAVKLFSVGMLYFSSCLISETKDLICWLLFIFPVSPAWSFLATITSLFADCFFTTLDLCSTCRSFISRLRSSIDFSCCLIFLLASTQHWPFSLFIFLIKGLLSFGLPFCFFSIYIKWTNCFEVFIYWTLKWFHFVS